MNCQLNKDDILELAAQYFNCSKTSLKIIAEQKVINDIAIENNEVIGEVLPNIPNVVYFYLSGLNVKSSLGQFILAFKNIAFSIDNQYPADGVLFDYMTYKKVANNAFAGICLYYKIIKLV